MHAKTDNAGRILDIGKTEEGVDFLKKGIFA